jgi:hypothetical protein
MFEKPQKAQVVRIKIEAISLDSTSIAPSLDGPLLVDCRRCLRILEWRLDFSAAQVVASMAEGQQASVPIQSLLMQINADAACLVRTRF